MAFPPAPDGLFGQYAASMMRSDAGRVYTNCEAWRLTTVTPLHEAGDVDGRIQSDGRMQYKADVEYAVAE